MSKTEMRSGHILFCVFFRASVRHAQRLSLNRAARRSAAGAEEDGVETFAMEEAPAESVGAAKSAPRSSHKERMAV